MTTNIQVPRVNGVAVTTFLACVAAGAAVSVLMRNPAALIAGVLVGTYPLVCDQGHPAVGKGGASAARKVRGIARTGAGDDRPGA